MQPNTSYYKIHKVPLIFSSFLLTHIVYYTILLHKYFNHHALNIYSINTIQHIKQFLLPNILFLFVCVQFNSL